MIRNFKILGASVVAILAMSAVLASGVQAAKFTIGAASGTLKAEQATEQVFTTTAGTVKCSTSTQEGSYSSSEIEEVEVSATYSGCKAFGFLSATVNMGKCKYRFTGFGQVARTFIVDIVCTSGDITVTTLSCTIHVPPQNGIAHAVMTNTPAFNPDDVLAELTFSPIEYTETAGCPNVSSNATTLNGNLTGTATVKAFNTSGTQVNLTAD